MTSLNTGQIKKYKLIFSAQGNNFYSFSFHEICSKDATNTLILIKTVDNNIIGGFTFASWEPNFLISYDDKAFMFNLNKKQKFKKIFRKYSYLSFRNDIAFGLYGNR